MRVKSTLSTSMMKIIDSHVHVWNNGAMPFSYSGNIFTASVSEYVTC